MNKQRVMRGSSFFHSQSPQQQEVLTSFLMDKSNNLKWLNYAQFKFSVKSKFSNPGPLEPEDYINNAREIILKYTIVIDPSKDSPQFKFKKDDKTYLMTKIELVKYFLSLIKWDMSHEFRSEQKTIPLPHWDEDDEGEPSSEDDTLLCKKSSKNEFIAQFDDPFEQSPIFQSKEFIDLCCSSLEKKNLLYELLFEERLNGKPNRDIARKYKLSVRQVENIRKKINRHITSIH